MIRGMYLLVEAREVYSYGVQANEVGLRYPGFEAMRRISVSR